MGLSAVSDTTKMAARYYVYELIDPRTWQTFYVGKGQRNRLWAHEREALEGGTHPKCQVVRDIWESGHAVGQDITPAISAFVNSAVKRMGQEAVAAAVLPHGVEVSYARSQE